MSARSVRRAVAAIASVAMLAACAPTPSQISYNAAYQDCSYGVERACAVLPVLAAQAQAEQQQRDTDTAVTVAGVALLGALVGLAASDTGGGHHYHRGGGYRGRY